MAVLDQQRVGLEGVDLVAEEEVGDLAGVAPGLVDPQPARVVVEQERRRARLLDLLVDRLAVAGLEAVGEPLELAVEHEAAARLEDVRAQAEHARVVQERGLAAAGVRDDLDLGPGTGLERPRAEQGEPALPVVEQRRAAARAGSRRDRGRRRGARALVSHQWSSSETSSRGTSCSRRGGRMSAWSRRARSTRSPAASRRSPRSCTPRWRTRCGPAASSGCGRTRPRRSTPRGPGRRSSRPARRRASRCASSSPRSTSSPATRAPARSTSTRRRRSPRTRRAR